MADGKKAAMYCGIVHTYQNERLCLAMYVHVQGNAQYVHTVHHDSTMTSTRAG